MSEKRRDNKGRILKTGESQRKDGRYLYKYVDSFGEPQFIYSWNLALFNTKNDEDPRIEEEVEQLEDKILRI
nr:integrase DNA-binding domain-containing protein [Streptococcus agalactiae]